ncbi:MAG: hypothetical protein AAF628_17645 [Planctomycetota bacterium]
MRRTTLGLSLLITASLASAQSVDRVMPDAAAEGDLLILEGAELADATHVRFLARVGGFVGTWVLDQEIESATDSRVEVRVPTTFGFAPPSASAPGDPMGTVQVVTRGQATNSLAFFYLEATWVPVTEASPQTTTLAQGTTQSTGLGRPVVSFDVPNGPPQPGNDQFRVELQNGIVGAPAALLIGVPSPLPPLPIGDGLLVVGLAVPSAVVGGFVVDGQGEAQLLLPIPGPGPFGVGVLTQWVLLDGGQPGNLAVSNALSFLL